MATIESATKDLAGDITDLQRSQFIEMRDQKLCVILSGIRFDSGWGQFTILLQQGMGMPMLNRDRSIDCCTNVE